RSPKSRSASRRSSASPGACASTRAARRVRRASCSTASRCGASDGRRARRSTTPSQPPIAGCSSARRGSRVGEPRLERIFRALHRIRRVEEEIARVYPTDVIKSPVHLSIGQEAVSVGLCEALGPEDAVFGSYRSHALYLAKGGDLRAMIAELYG